MNEDISKDTNGDISKDTNDNVSKARLMAEHYESGQLGGSFSEALINLICKADDTSKRKLGEAFPLELNAYKLWYSGAYLRVLRRDINIKA